METTTDSALALNNRLRAHYQLLSELRRIDPLPEGQQHIEALHWGLHYLACRCSATAAYDQDEDPGFLPRLLAVYPVLEQYRTPEAATPFEVESIMQDALVVTVAAIQSHPDDEQKQYRLRFVTERLLACEGEDDSRTNYGLKE